MTINTTGFIPIQTNIQTQSVQQKKVEEKPEVSVDKTMSQSAKYMIGASALAGVIALGIIGHKNNWWKNAQKIVEKGAKNDTKPPVTSPVLPSTPPAASTPVSTGVSATVKDTAAAPATGAAESAKPVARTPKKQKQRVKESDPAPKIINNIKAALSKETKRAKRALRQYNEIYAEFHEITYAHGRDYLKYLKEHKIPFEICDDGIKVFDKDGKLTRIIKNLTKDNRICQTYIEYYDKNGKLSKMVSFADSAPTIYFYDHKGNLSKRIYPIGKIGGLRPNVMVSEFKNKRLTKEAIYIQPAKYGVDNNYDTASVFKVINHKKSQEYGKIHLGSTDNYAIVSQKTYRLRGNNKLEEMKNRLNGDILGNDSFEAFRYHKFNRNNEIVREKELSPGHSKYSTLDCRTGKESSCLTIKNGKLEAFVEYDGKSGNITRKIIEDFDDETMLMEIPFVNGKGDMEHVRRIKKSDFDPAPLLERYKFEYIK